MKSKVIPVYASDFKNEFLFIRGINKTCEGFLKRLDKEEEKIFDTPKAKKLMFYFRKFLKALELGYLKDICEFYFEESDVNYIESLELQLDYYLDLFYDPDSYEYDPKKYDNVYPGLREFSECFERFKNKINISYFERKIIILHSDSDSKYYF